MKEDIRSKLRREFSEPIQSERQVVYILVEIRKLLELNDDAEHFPALNFYCDWAAHAAMVKEGAKRIVGRFNEWQKISDEARASGIEPILDQHLKAELDETTELRRFREQLACTSSEISLTRALRQTAKNGKLSSSSTRKSLRRAH